MRIKTLTCLGVVTVLSSGLFSCIKNDYAKLGDTGTPRVRLGEGTPNVQFFSPFSDEKTIDVITVRRDEVSQSAASQAVTVTIVNSPDSISAYNDANGTSYEPVPDSIYTLVPGKGVAQSGDNFTVTFDPAVTAVPVSIVLNGGKWDYAHTYAFYFKITDGSGKEINSEYPEALSVIAVKNKYDGKYTVTGSLSDISVPTITGFYPWDCELHTTGLNSVAVWDPYYGDIYHAILSGTDRSVYGAFGMEITFDPVTNEVVSITSPWAPASNTRDVLLDDSQTYFWDESTKTMDIKYYMVQPNQPAPVAAPLYIRTTFIENYKYTGSR